MLSQRKIQEIFRETLHSWQKNKTDQMAAALSYYAMLSLPSIVIFTLAVVSFFYSSEEAKAHIGAFLQSSFDAKISQSLSTIIDAVLQSKQKASASIISIFVFFWTTITLFEQVITSLQTIWKIERKKQTKIKQFLINKVLAFFFILFVDAIFLFSFLLQSAIVFLKKYFPFGNESLEMLFRVFHLIAVFMLPFLLILLIFKFLSSGIFSWKESAIGASLTTFLSLIGNSLLGMYLQKFADYSAFGGANVLIVILVWIYYFSQIFFLGAEFTYAFAGKKKG